MDLSELINAHRGGRSYNELARDCGSDAPSGKRLQQLATGTIKNFPDPPTIRALARGLRVPHTAVVLAAAESLGLDVRQSLPRLVELLPVSARDLSEEQAAAIAHLVRTFTEPEPEQMQADVPLHLLPVDPGPGVAEVIEAQVRHLQAVAQSGDASSPEVKDAIDRLAAFERLSQTGQDS